MGNQLIRRYFEMVAAGTLFFLVTGLSIIGPSVVLYIGLFTRYWYFAVLYLTWIWFIDIDTSEKGGRSIDWIRSSKLFDYAKDYYPVKLHAVPGFKLDPKRNYMFCDFPHGLMPNGLVIALLSNCCGIRNFIPNHQTSCFTLHSNFKIPLFRDFGLSIGLRSVTAKSINWLLSRPEGGQIAVIVVGGTSEALYATPGEYKIVLKRRKGFVQLALKNGSPLVPVFSFGEVDTLKHIIFSEDSWVRRFQIWFINKTGVYLPLFNGRGYFQNYIGVVPLKTPIDVVIGNPIEVEKNSNPTQTEIDELQQMFMVKLTELFEENKHKYIKNAEKTSLIIT